VKSIDYDVPTVPSIIHYFTCHLMSTVAYALCKNEVKYLSIALIKARCLTGWKFGVVLKIPKI